MGVTSGDRRCSDERRTFGGHSFPPVAAGMAIAGAPFGLERRHGSIVNQSLKL
ncbi:hypothetical protein HMPREF9374_2778 [Desmospora sp. 8437]|nr:hypothetical protein HMPREF9374_2778 [Desmospora sp. 8437]